MSDLQIVGQPVDGETYAYCLTVLEVMPSSADSTAKWDAHRLLWARTLKQLGPSLSKRSVEFALDNLKWRPSFAELRMIAAKLESPIPDRDAAYAEVLHKIQQFGAYGAPMKDFEDRFPDMRQLGTPPFSHALVAVAVQRCGGWQAICDGEAQYQEGGFSGHFKGNYDRAAETWYEKVIAAIDQGERPAHLFPAFEPYEPASIERAAKRAVMPAQAPKRLEAARNA